jgi:hypothetical protein
MECSMHDIPKENSDYQQEAQMTPVEKISRDPSAATTSALLHKRKLSKAPLVATDVRGSERVKATNQGFKQDVCAGKACFCCDVEALFCLTK